MGNKCFGGSIFLKVAQSWSVDFFDFHTTSGQKQWQKSLSVPNFVFFGKSIAEWGHGWVVHRWFENTIFDILWFWREIYESRKDQKMSYMEPFELAIWRIDSPMSQLPSGKITASNGASFGTLSPPFDDGFENVKFQEIETNRSISSILVQILRFLRFFSNFRNLTPCQKLVSRRQIMRRLKPWFLELKA